MPICIYMCILIKNVLYFLRFGILPSYQGARVYKILKPYKQSVPMYTGQ